MPSTDHFQRTRKALELVKENPATTGGAASVLAIILLMAGFWLDYQDEIKSLDNKGERSEDARIEKDEELQDRMQFVFERALEVENRLATLESEVKQLQKADATFFDVLFRGGASNPASDELEAEDVEEEHSTREGLVKSTPSGEDLTLPEPGELPRLKFEPSQETW